MKWSKEEIMAYVDGQLPESEIIRVEKVIDEDTNARNYYDNLIESNDLINISYSQIEKSYISRVNQSQTSNNQKNNEKKINSKFASSIAIQYKGVLGVALFGIALVIGAFQVGKNSQNILERNQGFEMMAINNVIKNKDQIQNHIKKNNLKDLRINIDEKTTAVVKFRDRTFDNNQFCQKIVVKINENEYNLDTCKIDIEEDEWSYQFIPK